MHDSNCDCTYLGYLGQHDTSILIVRCIAWEVQSLLQLCMFLWPNFVNVNEPLVVRGSLRYPSTCTVYPLYLLSFGGLSFGWLSWYLSWCCDNSPNINSQNENQPKSTLGLHRCLLGSTQVRGQNREHLTEGEGSVQLTSCWRVLVLYKSKWSLQLQKQMI